LDHNITSFVLDLLDFYEELNLSLERKCLCVMAACPGCDLVIALSAYLKHRGKFSVVVEGDENTRFFRAWASQRLHRNHIRVLDVDGPWSCPTDVKAAALHAFYADLLDRSTPPVWDFNVNALYSSSKRKLASAHITEQKDIYIT
jgi:hypothetical protein